MKPYATWARIAHLCVCSVSSIGDGVYNFTNIPLPEDEAARWVEEAQRRGVKSVALLWQDYPSVNGHVRALREEAARRGLRVTSANRFASNTTDFTAAIAEANTPRSRERCATAGGARRVEGEAVDLSSPAN